MSAPLSTMPNKGLILGVYGEESKENSFLLSKASQAFDEKCNGQLSKTLGLFGNSFKKGKSHLLFGLHDEFPLVSVVNVGKKGQGFNEHEELDEGRENVRAAVAKGVLQLRSADQYEVLVDPCGDAMAAAEGCHLSEHKYDELKPADKRKPPMQLSCFTENLNADERTEVEAAWQLGATYAMSQNFARLLMEMPANLLTPTRFAEMVTEKLQELCEVVVRDQSWAESKKMGAFLSVSHGSMEPLRFVEVSYNGGEESAAPIALVGKGITFDAGGISLKPPADMDKMRADMGGAACVVGTLFGAAKLQLPINLKAFIPLCENMPSGTATKPGDVVTAMNGKTIQVDNTDAEGRLILADALSYACTFNPQFILDMATLTGAMIIALGSAAAGTFTNSSELWKLLHKAGGQTGDRLWRMPLFQHYTENMTSCQLAALNNIGNSRAGGSCTAAAFLKEFVGENQWIHIDIAGVMMNKDEVPYLGTGMAGRPTRTAIMTLVIPEKFQHILRIMNTNIDGRRKSMFAITAIKGIGRRFSNVVCKKANIDLKKRAGELTEEEVDRVLTVMSNPRQYKIPDWFLNRQKDIKDGKYSQVMANNLDNKLREDLERLKKIRAHRGLRHFWGLRVRGQHTKTTGRRGRTVGVAKKK